MKKSLLVTGDITVDWLFLNANPAQKTLVEYSHAWNADMSCDLASQAGGAAMLSKLLQEAQPNEKSLSAYKICGPDIGEAIQNSPMQNRVDKTFTLWAPFPEKRAAKKLVWRAKEFVGQSKKQGSLSAFYKNTLKNCSPEFIAIDDANLGFRDADKLWGNLITNKSGVKSIILKIASPLATGKLWNKLASECADILTVIVSINDLRKDGCYIGNALSWEQIYEDIVSALKGHVLAKASRIIVSIGSSGAVLVEKNNKPHLIFSPSSQEGDWEGQYPGFVMGQMTCLTAAILLETLKPASKNNWSEAVRRGLQASRTLLVNGYALKENSNNKLEFPFPEVISALNNDSHDFAHVQLDDKEQPYSILRKNIQKGQGKIALSLAAQGPEKILQGVPLERIGAWSSVDRTEIENIRSVRNIMAEYIAHYKSGARLDRPLSVAVFGPPGAGKSFSIKQVAKALLPGELKKLEFNLSQFQSIKELTGAFHQVQDLVLSQNLPLVFWDEFDSGLEGKKLGWLKYFLAPMQDGEFREEGFSHPIGPAIFIFAGGTCSSLQQFEAVTDIELDKNAKKPDFISRLKGYVNILGPNPMDKSDKDFMIRRAFLFWALLSRKAPHLFQKGIANVDPNILKAFIRIDKFYHGARSMEAIIDMSALSGKLSFQKSSLPAKNQLGLHVDADSFINIVK